ncbi:MAG: LmeA family phospholipid-binding protein, partial [Rubrobacteraceae bacterium]
TPTVELVNDEAPLEMLLGRFTGGTVSMSDAVFGGVRTDSVVMDLDPFDVDARESIASRSLQSEDLRGDLRVEVSEEEVSRLAESRAGVPFEGVELSEGEMLVNTSVAVLGNEVPLTVRGGVGLEGRELSFLPGSIAIAGADLPQEAVREILGDLEVTFELEGFPRGADIQEARIEEGVIVLTGRMERLSPAGG